MITSAMISELRAKTGAGIINCRDTLQETNGDLEKAVAILKEKGLAIAAKKVERITAEGLISSYISEDQRAGAIVELNCETDFVAIHEEFRMTADNLARQAVTTPARTVADFGAERYIGDPSLTVRDALTALIAKLRENITLHRFAAFQSEYGFVQNYLHGGRIGVLLEMAGAADNPALRNIAKEIALQIAAARPLFITRDDVDPELLARESEAYKAQALSEGKPEAIAAKIVTGKIAKYLKEKCLMEQVWIKNEDLTVAGLIREESRKSGAAIRIVRFVRFEKGEGMAKREENLAQAVRQQILGF